MGGLVALALIGSVTFLISEGKSTGDLVSLIGTGLMPILGLALYGKLGGIQQQTNGTTGELVTMVKSLQAELARRPLPHPGTPELRSGTGPEDDFGNPSSIPR